MVIIMSKTATEKNIKAVAELLKSRGLKAHISEGSETTIIGIVGNKQKISDINLELLDGVDKTIPIVDSFKLASKAFNPDGIVVDVGGVKIGGGNFALIAGPCAAENEEQVISTAKAVKKSGANFLRGGAYKPRTSPYSFQGLEDYGYKLLREAADETGLKVVSEVISEVNVETAAKYCDMLQVGARNMQNFGLLRELGRSKMPVLLKRGNSSTITEWLDAAEYIMNEGNYNVVLCERGIRTFETATRNTLDISAIPVIKEKSCLPIIVDPSHAAGKAAYIESLSMAAVAAGADGLIIEVHPDPLTALSDAPQQLNFDAFDKLCGNIKKLAQLLESKI